MKVHLSAESCNVGFILGDVLGWVFRSAEGEVTITKRVAKRAPAIVRTSPADFLRLITRDVAWDDAIADGRVTVDGDRSELDRMFAGQS